MSSPEQLMEEAKKMASAESKANGGIGKCLRDPPSPL
jgi:hypothetical protein